MICHGCNAPIPGSVWQHNNLHYCQPCYTSLILLQMKNQGSSGPMGPDGLRGPLSCECEECGVRYHISRNWTNERICEVCENQVRHELGEPALDADLTPEERNYLRQSLGMSPIDPQLDLDKPFCQSCINHGADRKGYPCLREDACGWARRTTTNANLPQVGDTFTINITTNAATTSAVVQDAIRRAYGLKY